MTLIGDTTAVFERGDFVYFVSTVAPYTPADSEIEEFSFGAQIREMAPNPNLLWLHGTYVEGGKPNANGQEWAAADLTIKSLTPIFCPVTVMHDPRSAVGLIADTRLVPGTAEGPTRIDDTLAIWAHRFPEVAQEIAVNHSRGTLMQSQECRPAYWECGPCGQRFLDKPRIAEHQQREHSALDRNPVRKLGNVTFTGTGLVFGTRGARGALSSAHLDLLEEEVAEFHERSRSKRPAPNRRTSSVDIEQKDYEALVAKAGKVDDLEARVRTAEESAAKVPDLEKKVETLEIEKKTVTDERDAEKSKREGLEEASRAVTLSTERMGKLGKGFVTKLPDSVKTKLEEQAKSLSDEDWTGRLDELSAMMGGTKPDDPGEGTGTGTTVPAGGGGTFSREETSQTQTGSGGGGTGGDASRAATSQVVGSLLHRLGPQRKQPETTGSTN